MTAKERFKITVAVYLVLERDEQILLSRRFNTGYEDGNYGLPSGHADGNESLKAALVREAREEIGIELDEEDLGFLLTMHRFCPDREYLDVFFSAWAWDDEPTNREPDKCDELRWCDRKHLPANLVPYVRHALKCIEEGVPYTQFGWT